MYARSPQGHGMSEEGTAHAPVQCGGQRATLALVTSSRRSVGSRDLTQVDRFHMAGTFTGWAAFPAPGLRFCEHEVSYWFSVSPWRWFWPLQIYYWKVQSSSKRNRRHIEKKILTFQGSKTHGMLPGLQPYSHYFLNVRVVNGKGEGPASSDRGFHTPEGGKEWLCLWDQAACSILWKVLYYKRPTVEKIAICLIINSHSTQKDDKMSLTCNAGQTELQNSECCPHILPSFPS